MIVFLWLDALARQRPSLLLEEKGPQAAAWGGCGVTAIRFRRNAPIGVTAYCTPHQSRYARQLLPKARFAVLKEKPWALPRQYVLRRETIISAGKICATE